MTTPDRTPERQIACLGCGSDITRVARYTTWTRCSPCYWKHRLERFPSIESLLKQGSDTKSQLEATREALKRAETEAEGLALAVNAAAPWWQPVSNLALGFIGEDATDKRVLAAQEYVRFLRKRERELEGLSSRLESDAKTARHVRKRLDSTTRTAARQREAAERKNLREQAFAEISRRAAPASYDRHLFMIRKQDYKRGNPLDNHFRNGFLENVLAAFHSECLACRSTHDLTLDHWAIPKNEGGNFVLPLADCTGIRLNVVVLCRSCNSSKGEISYRHYFSPEQLQEAETRQKSLLEAVLGSEKTMSVIRSWCSI